MDTQLAVTSTSLPHYKDEVSRPTYRRITPWYTVLYHPQSVTNSRRLTLLFSGGGLGTSKPFFYSLVRYPTGRGFNDDSSLSTFPLTHFDTINNTNSNRQRT